jgi:hypothetical protein
MLSTQGWRTEGEIMQKIADVHELRAAGADEVAAPRTNCGT